jgi:predicted transcriptional regulator
LKRFDLILKIIQNNPGIHIRGIIEETGLENGVVMHYLEKLDKQGKIKSKKYTRYKRYYSLDIDEEEYDIIRNLRKLTKKKILLNIIVQGNPSFKEIVSKIDRSPATVSWNLSELIKNNVIEKYKKDSKVYYRIKNIKLLKHTFRKEFSKLLDEKKEHSEDIFLAL